MPVAADNTETGVANQALSIIKAPSILQNVEDDSEKNARVIRVHYVPVRRALLRRHQWNFAETRVSLPAAAAVPAFGYDRYFELPADCVRVLTAGGDPIFEESWKVIGRNIATSMAAPLDVVYVRDVQNPAQWDALFRMAYVASLALAIAPEIVTDKTTRAEVMAEAREALVNALAPDSGEGAPDDAPEFDIITERFR